jgi:hypothetical protein
VVYPFTGYGVPGALDTTRKRMVFTRSGGHGGWAMFEVDEADWATGTWNPDGRPQNPYTKLVRKPVPTYQSGEYMGGSPDSPGALLDPHHYYDSFAKVDRKTGMRIFPNALHPGDSMVFMPSVGRFFIWGGFSFDWGGNYGGIIPFEWDPSTKQWEAITSDLLNVDTTTTTMCWDTTHNWVVFYTGQSVYRYDPAGAYGARTALLVNRGALIANEQGRLLCDAKRNRAVYLTYGTGNGGSFYVDLSTGAVTTFSLTGAITNGTLNTKHPGWASDPIGDRYILWIGGKTVYWVNPTTFVATAYTPAGGIDPGTRTFGTGTNGGYLFAYQPGDDVFIGINNADTQGFEVFAPLRP